MERRVRHYQLSITEMLGLSVLNPAGAAIIGWGVNLAASWAEMDAGKPKTLIGATACGALIVGVGIVLLTWTFFAIVWFQSKSND
jgi:hypothetical protein